MQILGLHDPKTGKLKGKYGKRGKRQGATSAQAKKGRSPQTKRKAAAKKAGTTKKRPAHKR